MRLHIRHETRYTYDSPVRDSIQYIRLTPRNTPQQRIHQWKLTTPGETSQMVDGFGNLVTVMTLAKPVSEIILTAEGIVDLTGKPLTRDDSPFPPAVFLRQTPLTEADAALKELADQHTPNKRGLLKLMQQLRDHVAFQPGATTVSHTASEAYSLKAGVCQDHTHMFLACCRHIGVPARYVSGYIHSPNDDHVATHAWAEAWIGRNWQTFDVVNTLNVAESHIKLAVGLDYRDSAPVRGVRGGGGTEHMSTRAWVTDSEISQ
ncbi:transglutaminase family protein [Marinobacter oulmenensis]|uniref:Transglutaminase-like putative cysteine protease n=1 Tax=Marinobacter oulmenensis TaxID=643747 RepID=A0A840UJU4_9GAMM|nr:transglutaminase family protein [Marinobacter oulmenensis]MBB5321018.1 transglutaminase-like putative cysteine protease [Marinobacter oulmenensis]